MLTAFAQSANVWFAKAVYTSYENDPQRYVDFLRSLHLDRTVGLESFGEATPMMPDYKTKYNWNGRRSPTWVTATESNLRQSIP